MKPTTQREWKKLIGLILLVLLIGCKKAPTYEDIAIEKVKENLLDPNSFELIKIERDTARMSDNYQRLSELKTTLSDRYMNLTEDELDKSRMYVNINLKKAKELARNANKYLQKVTEYANEASKYDSIKNSLIGTENDSIMEFNFFVRGYAMARGGNKTIGDWQVSFDQNFKFLDVISVE